MEEKKKNELIFDASFREYKNKNKNKLVHESGNSMEDGIIFEIFVASSILRKNFIEESNLEDFWVGLLGNAEKGVDFIYLDKDTLNIFNFKFGRRNFSYKSITEIKNCLIEFYEENADNFKNEVLKKFILIKKLKILIYFIVLRKEIKIKKMKNSN